MHAQSVRAVVLCSFALVVGCGENVLVGNWQLLSASDAGSDEVEEFVIDAGLDESVVAAKNAQDAKEKFAKKHGGKHPEDDKANDGH